MISRSSLLSGSATLRQCLAVMNSDREMLAWLTAGEDDIWQWMSQVRHNLIVLARSDHAQRGLRHHLNP